MEGIERCPLAAVGETCELTRHSFRNRKTGPRFRSRPPRTPAQGVLQCKRVGRLDPTSAEDEIEKLKSLPEDTQPAEVVFLVSTNVSATARDRARAEWGDEANCQFWAGSELDERVKRYADILCEFFDLGREGLKTLAPAGAAEPPLYFSTYISYSRTDAGV